MSGNREPANTIRRAIGNAPWDYKTRNEGREALDALLAENQRLDELAQTWMESYRVEANRLTKLQAENQRLRERLRLSEEVAELADHYTDCIAQAKPVDFGDEAWLLLIDALNKWRVGG